MFNFPLYQVYPNLMMAIQVYKENRERAIATCDGSAQMVYRWQGFPQRPDISSNQLGFSNICHYLLNVLLPYMLLFATRYYN